MLDCRWQRQQGTGDEHSDLEEKGRNREIAQNEAHRKAVSAVRVSSWAIALASIGLTSRRHSAVRVAPPAKSVHTPSNVSPHSVSMRASL